VQFHTAYNLPCKVGGTAAQSVCAAPSSFGGQTIGIIDAYVDSNIESDLGVYDTQFGLPSCTQANGCLQIVNLCQAWHIRKQKSCGYTDGSWALETSLDVEVAHATCQTCKILLVEANTSNWGDLVTAENIAAQDGATEISNSWGGGEWSGQTQYDSAWSHPGVAVTFSTGDGGYGIQYPSSVPTVIAVGGTTLRLGPGSAYGSETAWGGTGSGCSQYESANSWQVSLSNWSATGCGTFRAASDMSADADPSTGAAVYQAGAFGSNGGWMQVGGTSLAAPLVASAIALAGGAAGFSNPSQLPYVKAGSASSHDVTVGTNGTCSTSMCTAGIGFDGPTGLGTPNGTGGL
jgi:subtilase family serine protease